MKMMTTTIANDIDGANGDDDSAPIPRGTAPTMMAMAIL